MISGFLITGILAREVEQGTFSLRRFWTRRLRRIAPASLVVTVATLLAGLFILMPDDLVPLAKATIAQQTMLTNVYEWRNMGYLDTHRPRPLLHMWSLAVEEHTAAHSNVGRRAELADAWYILGVANLQRQQRLDASEAFLHVGALYPHYLEERATNVPVAARPLLAAAQREAERKELLPSEVAEVRDLLHVDWVVTGAVTEDGEIVARLWGPESTGGVRPYADLKGYFLPVPVPEVNDVYARLATEIGKRAVAPVSAGEAEEPREEAGTAGRRQPLVRQWWFWAGTGAGVGGGALVGYALWEPAPVEVPGDPTWSVTVSGVP